MPSTNDASIVLPACLLSNGRYTVMTSATGSGFSRWCGLSLTRWREDATAPTGGSYLIVRDTAGGLPWSVTAQPFGLPAPTAGLRLSNGHAQYRRRRGALAATLAVAVLPDIDGELRSLVLRNAGATARTVDVTTYTELVLGGAAADAAHPAFSKLFIETDWDAQRGALLATRRRRSPDETPVWIAHHVVVDPADADGGRSAESDRARFLGRGRPLSRANALNDPGALSGTVGAVLDPVFSLRCRVRVEPGAHVRLNAWTVVASTREGALAACDATRTAAARERAFADAGAHERDVASGLGIGAAERAQFQRMIAPLLTADPAWRARPDAIAGGTGGAPVLWAQGISGDRAIVLVEARDDAGAARAARAMLAQRYWQALGLGVDVVVLAADGVRPAVDAAASAQRAQPAGVPAAALFVLAEREVTDTLRHGLAAAARIVRDVPLPDAGAAPLAERAGRAPLRRVRRTANGGGDGAAPVAPSRSPAPLALWNGIGGFDVDAREYVIRLAGEAWTPAPWINVLANPAFGCLVSAEGGGYTWSVNSQQNALTPWPNDPVTDAPHEIVYLRDDDTHAVWTSTPQPIRVADTGYETRHGKGYTVFHHVAHGIDVEVTVCVPPVDSVKLSRVRMRNVSGTPRRLTLTGFVEWALAPNGVVAAPTIVTAIDDATGALLARNAWREEFGERTAFIDFGDGDQTASGDRRSFLGDLGTIERPAALATSERLDGRVGGALDPCGSVRTRLELGPGEVRERVFMLGDAASPALARELVRRYRDTAFDTVLSAVAAQWGDLLDVVRVETPDAALDMMVNDWLLYQTLACRVWARTAYYQASGAFGFRDQLQDVMALCVARPDLAREHLLRAASRQFAEGDVQHWWLPPSGRGLRTRMTDDRLWLAYVTAHYVEVTGDTRVLDEPIAFVTGPTLDDGQLDAFFAPGAGDTASLYEHCARAVDISLRRGRHGLPLIGTGDWNDGMNRVGSDGRGESVWLAWFTVATIDAMLPITAQRADSPRERAWRDHAAALRAAVEVAGWDGSEGRWYRRGYYDDGTPLGSRDSDDCRIDVIAQSWSVIAGANDPQRPARAMAAVDDHLIRDRESLALLLAPPFDRGAHDPGYIKAYPPGIRENGGQYTHGAIWSIFAMAMLGRGDRAHALFAMLNPIAHSSSAAAVARYRVEPYVACADVYAVAPHVGRGGWTWYTGSAGWLYRAGIEAILGFRLRGDLLNVDPCVPSAWREYRMTFTRRGGGGVATRYRIVVANPLAANRGVADATLDGSAVALGDGGALVPLSHDGGIHEVRVTLGSPSGVPPEGPDGGGITASRPRA